MKRNRRKFISLLNKISILLFVFIVASCVPKKIEKNVLFINVDDLRPQLGCYEESLPLNGQSVMKTPSIDKLADNGVLFERAYCAVAVCGASRLSFLTGSRPYKEPRKPWGRHWAYYSRLDEEERNEPAGLNHPGNSVTMPEHFKNNGYKTLSIGKVYHDIRDDEDSWDEKLKLPQETWHGIPAYEIGEGEKDDNYYVDGRTTNYVINKLDELKNEKFFYGVGFARPHLPFNSPKKYWELYPEEKIKLPPNNSQPINAPKASIHNFQELRNYSGIEYFDSSKEYLSNSFAKKLIRGYYASTSYVDAQIGRIIEKLKSTKDDEGISLYDKTIIVIIGDHGWSLEEHNLWCKHASYNTLSQAPLIIRDPELEEGKRSPELVEYVDIFPTLCDLTETGKPKSTVDNDGSTFNLQGTSLLSLLEDPDKKWKQAVFSRYQFGDMIKTDRFAYTEFVDQDDNIVGRMLYDHLIDPHENYNIAELNPELVERFSELLGKGPIGKRNAWRKFVDESNENMPLDISLNLPEPIYPKENYPGIGKGR